MRRPQIVGAGALVIVGVGAWLLSPALLGPSTGQVQADWNTFVRHRDACLATVKLGSTTVTARHVTGDVATVTLRISGEWVSGAPDPGWLGNTPCQGFHSRSEWLQTVDRDLVYQRDGIGWRIDPLASFGLSDEQMMAWELHDQPKPPTAEPIQTQKPVTTPTPSTPPPSPGREALLRGASLLAANRLREAELSLRRAVALDSTLGRGFVLLGQCRDRQGQPAEAEAAFRRALAIDPAPALPYLYLGQLLHNQGRSAEAVPVLEAGLARVLGEQRAVDAELRATLREAKSAR
jgi:hypothetical protein